MADLTSQLAPPVCSRDEKRSAGGCLKSFIPRPVRHCWKELEKQRAQSAEVDFYFRLQNQISKTWLLSPDRPIAVLIDVFICVGGAHTVL